MSNLPFGGGRVPCSVSFLLRLDAALNVPLAYPSRHSQRQYFAATLP
jgi:hypothetical protein